MSMSHIIEKAPVFDPGICRLCGNIKRCRVLNVEYEYLTKKEIYSDIMMDCFGLLLSHLDGDIKERLICATCVNQLRLASDFHKQVIMCEEAFVQRKISDVIESEPKEMVAKSAAEDKAASVEVKVERFCDTEASELEHMDYDDATDNSTVEVANVKLEKMDTSHSNRLSNNERKTKAKKFKPRAISNDLKTANRMVIKKNTSKNVIARTAADGSTRISWSSYEKNQIPMLKVQQLIREKDPSYINETNITALIEYSYIIPFKCRHNHLLCYYCGTTYLEPTKLREHTLTKHLDLKKFKIAESSKMTKIDITRIDCRLCDSTIECLDDFKMHITTVHKKVYYMNCKEKVLPFSFSDDRNKCALCDETFPFFHALNKHMNVHFSNFVCETCGLGFLDKARFVMHQQRHEVGDYPCEECGKVFKAQFNKDLHVDRVHRKRGRVYCPQCDAVLMSYGQKLKHLATAHGAQPQRFPCLACARDLPSRRALTLHTRKAHLRDYRYDCQFCGQKFFTRHALNNHLPTHTGERNFKCKVCEKSYPRLKTLKDHMRIHTNDRRYRCHVCAQAFIQNCSLKGHMKSQHPEYG